VRSGCTAERRRGQAGQAQGVLGAWEHDSPGYQDAPLLLPTEEKEAGGEARGPEYNCPHGL
jgi:hypothetical protein